MSLSPLSRTPAATPLAPALPRPAPAPLPTAPAEPQDGARLSGAPATTSSRQTPSGIVRERHGDQVRIGLPNGISLSHEGSGPVLAHDAQGRSYPVKVERDAQGAPSEYRFQSPQGSVRLDATDLTLTLKNPADTVTQTLEASGRHVVQCQSCYRDPANGKMTDLVQSVVVEPDGLVRNLSRREGVEVSAARLSFRNPMGCKLSFDLPVPVSQPLQGQWVAQPAAPAPAPLSLPASPAGYTPLFMES